MPLPPSLYSAAQVRELDRRVIEQHRIPGAELMARAGAAAFRVLGDWFPDKSRLAVICGSGNNGGDGYVVAQLAKHAGFDPVVWTVGSRSATTGAAAQARAQCEAAGVIVRPFADVTLDGCDAIVDALFGTGLERPVTGEWLEAIQMINASGRPVISIDVPSGLNADTGMAMGAAVRADMTVSFIGLKAGLFTATGREHAGEIFFDDLGVPPYIYDGITPVARRLTEEALTGLLNPRPRDAHKGSFGRVLVVAGGRGMSGAARLCGEAAYRGGAGLVTLATHPDHATAVNIDRPELLAYGVAAAKDLKPLVARATVVAIGPGLSQEAWAQAMFRGALAAKAPLVVDADALNLLAEDPHKKDDWVLTPHPGEAARLLNISTSQVQADRFDAARKIADKFGGVCVLKGAGTLIANADEVWLCDRGNPGMASGGTGDVLTGLIAALRAQGLSPLDAARLGVWVHAVAGDDAAADGQIGLVASDLLPQIRRRLNQLVSDEHVDARDGE